MHEPRVTFRLVACILAIACTVNAWAQGPTPGASPPAQSTPSQVLFENVRVFDGKGSALSAPTNVLVRGNRIEKISATPIPTDATAGATIIHGGGRTLMPGLIDAHWHTTLVRPTPAQALSSDVGYTMLVAGAEATDTLMRGFTTVRDMGGPSFGLKRAIDEGLLPGPRIFPSGAILTVTGGHGDFRQMFEVPRIDGMPLTRMEELGAAKVTDSPDEVTRRAREQMMLGASQIKLTASGGVASPHSPIDVITFTPEELRAAVRVANDRGTYVAAHAYTPEAMQRAILAGVQCIEHGQLMDEATAKLMAEKGTWLSIQPFPDEFAHIFPPGSDQAKKMLEVMEGTNRAYELAKKYHLKTAWGSDILFSPDLAKRQGALLVGLSRWYTPAETLAMATGANGELLALSGDRSPYRGKLGVVEEGALADLLLVDGDPLKDIKLIEDPAKNFLVIMKDGRVFKNTMPK
ncbi:amidohydrolase family protein [Dyella solisilvae]|uniref:Amidohydrolase family protein n=1 Tax=Dyella solisilvae TaxID=1920168 RepID=A0A370K9S7_9GAMM|nr:amidohydrolase family protein [Dyella solisilvae]RDI99404.1 amidohydrolase family protein [Dyella solisilvae]